MAGTYLREYDKPRVYVTADDGQLIVVPTLAALFNLGGGWDVVHLIPANGLAANHLGTYPMRSGSATPSSMVFGPDGDCSPPGTRYPRSELPGVTLPNGCRVVELHGWLHPHDIAPGGDPDLSYGFTPDVTYLEARGVDFATFVTVGDIIVNAKASNHAKAAAFDPQIKIEVNGLPIRADGTPAETQGWNHWLGIGVPATCPPRAAVTPPDWTIRRAPQEVPQPDGHRDLTHLNPLWADVVWPYDPVHPTPGVPLYDGIYALVSGSVVRDQSHRGAPGNTAEYDEATDIWADGNNGSAGDASRWTEIHPPDVIDALPGSARPMTKKLTGIAVCASWSQADLFSPDISEVNVILIPPGPRPPGKSAQVMEYVGPETTPHAITAGNATLTGARLTNNGNHIEAYIQVTSHPFTGAAKFKGVYKLWWG
jgi:hypothetical protein